MIKQTLYIELTTDTKTGFTVNNHYSNGDIFLKAPSDHRDTDTHVGKPRKSTVIQN